MLGEGGSMMVVYRIRDRRVRYYNGMNHGKAIFGAKHAAATFVDNAKVEMVARHLRIMNPYDEVGVWDSAQRFKRTKIITNEVGECQRPKSENTLLKLDVTEGSEAV